MAWNLLKQLRNEESLDVRRRRFFKLGKIVAVGFLAGGILAAAQTYCAVRAGTVWRDYRGEPISTEAMYDQCLIFLGVSALGLALLLLFMKWSRRYENRQ